MFAVCRRLFVCGFMVWPFAVQAQNGAAVVVEMEKLVEAQAVGGAWKPAVVGQPLSIRDRLRTGEFSRAAVRFTDLSVLRVDELTTIEISRPVTKDGKQTLEVKRGGTYFFSRDKSQEIEIRTPAANGALRGTEFELRVAANGRTRLTMFDGEVDLGNAHGRVRLRSGEQAEVEVGRAPRKTAVIEAVNIIQWCLYYPAVLDPAELGIASGDRAFSAYRAGDLLGALEAHSHRRGAGSTGERLFHANLILASGQVDKARAALAGVPAGDSRRQALEQMIAGVKFQPWSRAGEPRTSSEWLAESYYLQSRSDLEGALRAARKATELSPEFGYAWARVAELEFSFGRTMRSMKVLERALELAPRNAQAHSLQGFLLTSENRIGAARRSFDQAIALDGALGNAWLGRGLTLIRQNQEDEGRRDLQTAAVLEPNRSILRSYLGKAFSQVGINAKANLEFERAKQLDPKDPTPWLYSAIQRKQENRYNEAIDDLEKSVDLNDNRRVYRSGFLLDQDRAVRGTNLAAIYLNDGMAEQSEREAVRAVNNDYSSAAAHLFLSNSYGAQSDPSRVRLRFETAAVNELLLSNLLSPVGGGPLSQFVSEQEYSKLFERDGLGISSTTEYRSDGQFSEVASQYGTFGNISYSLDAEYLYQRGVRPNNDLSTFDAFGAFKLQLTPQDTAYFQIQFGDQRAGDVFQRYDPDEVGRVTRTEKPGDHGQTEIVTKKNIPALSYRLHNSEEPALVLFGWHHEWNPGNHTLLLLGRLASDQTLSDRKTDQTIVTRDVALLVPKDYLPDTETDRNGNPVIHPKFDNLRGLSGRGPIKNLSGGTFDLLYENSFEAYSAELQQIATFAGQTLLLGGRYQQGQFDTHARLTNYNDGASPSTAQFFESPPLDQYVSVDFERISAYLYDTIRIAPWLSVTGGVTYDRIHFPDNLLNPPLNNDQAKSEQFSPKVGLTLEPWRGATVRAAYAKAIGGVSFDESIRLEPTQVDGFLQTYRSVISESLTGSLPGSKFRFSGISLEQKLPTRTYVGVEYKLLQQDVSRTIGTFDELRFGFSHLANFPSSITERTGYREDSVVATINQLVGDNWSLGTRYRLTRSKFHEDNPALDRALDQITNSVSLANVVSGVATGQQATIHELNLFALYNHPTGFFAKLEANWYQQTSDSSTLAFAPAAATAPDSSPRRITVHSYLPGEDFWQFNVLAGYRFHRNQCELSCGVLNLNNQDYRLSPVNPYDELPRDRTFVARCKLSF